MNKTFKVVMLPTEKKAFVFLNVDGKLVYHADDAHHNPTPVSIRESAKDRFKAQHLYIISDDEIKEGDWYISPGGIISRYNGSELLPNNWKKIIATTDKHLGEIPNSVPGFNFPDRIALPQLPESFIQAYIKAHNDGKHITEVDLEMDITGYDDDNQPMTSKGNIFVGQPKIRSNNTVIVHQSSNIKNIVSKAYNDYQLQCLNGDGDYTMMFDDWIEENL